MVERVGPAPELRRLFEAAGYRIEERSQGWVASRARDRRAVVAAAALHSPTDFEPWFPTDSVHRVLYYPEDPGEVARRLAADRGIEVLDPTTLGPALGELLLGPVLPAHEARDPSNGLPLVPPALLIPEGASTVRPRIGREEIEALAGGVGVRYTLRLVPHYLAPYRVRTPSPHGGTGAVSDHLVAVNALARRAEIWEPQDYELVGDLPGPYQRLQPEIGDGQAVAIAIQAIRRHHTVNVDHTEQHGEAIVIETRRLPPALDDIQLGPRVLVYVPYWYVEGDDGRIVLDAVTGRRTTEEELP
ncbi:MAG: hypothetical protein ABSA15_00460 [Thermoplasmata archaeon]|jgi:hypothetical protein